MIAFPNAKINLGLDILRRRPDGYHDIATLMYPVPWTDILEIVPSSGAETTLTVTGREVACEPERNLVMKAYRALNEIVELPPVNIHLHKIIPDGAGLGGGSADAAFTLTTLNSMFSLDLSQETLAEVAATLGADCPFFIYNTPMLCTATGTAMSPFPISLAGMIVAIIKPPVSVPTAAAYAGVTPCEPATPLQDALTGTPKEWGTRVANAFEVSVFEAFPRIREIKKQLIATEPDYCSMSGSGSSLYALYNNKVEADNLSRQLKQLFADCNIFVGSL